MDRLDILDARAQRANARLQEYGKTVTEAGLEVVGFDNGDMDTDAAINISGGYGIQLAGRQFAAFRFDEDAGELYDFGMYRSLSGAITAIIKKCAVVTSREYHSIGGDNYELGIRIIATYKDSGGCLFCKAFEFPRGTTFQAMLVAIPDLTTS